MRSFRCYSHDVSPDGKQLHVMYIDYGNSEWLEVDKVKRLPQPFFQLRPQGVLARLSGITAEDNGFLRNVNYHRFLARGAHEVA